MDALELPFDLIWEGKPEPLSPSQLALANAEDILIFDNDFENGMLCLSDTKKCGLDFTLSTQIYFYPTPMTLTTMNF